MAVSVSACSVLGKRKPSEELPPPPSKKIKHLPSDAALFMQSEGFNYLGKLPKGIFNNSVFMQDNKNFKVKIHLFREFIRPDLRESNPDKGELAVSLIPPHQRIIQLSQRFFLGGSVLSRSNEYRPESRYYVEIFPFFPGKCLIDIPQFSPKEVCLFGIQLAEAVAHLHRYGIAWRDLKPDNMLIIDDTELRIFDFDSAQKVVGNAPLFAMGTRHYTPPEMHKARMDTHPFKHDSFSLGVTLYVMISGDTPSRSSQPYADTETPLNLNLIPPMFRGLIAELIEKDPEKRWSIQQALERLTEVGGAQGWLPSSNSPSPLSSNSSSSSAPSSSSDGGSTETLREAANM